MRQTLSKSNGLPKIEVAKKLDLTVTGTSSVMAELPKQPARPSLPNTAAVLSRQSLNLKPKQVSFQCLGDLLGDENTESSSTVKACQ